MKVLKVSEIIRQLEKDGWYLKRQKGSHRQFLHPTKIGLTTVNGKPSNDVWGKLLDSIEKQSGIIF